jgi:hypothetical protein
MIHLDLHPPKDDAARGAARQRCVGEAQPNLQKYGIEAEPRQP